MTSSINVTVNLDKDCIEQLARDIVTQAIEEGLTPVEGTQIVERERAARIVEVFSVRPVTDIASMIRGGAPIEVLARMPRLRPSVNRKGARARKRPVEVDIVLADDAHHAASNAWNDLPQWLADAYELGHVLFVNGPEGKIVEVKTLEGWLAAKRGDWIVRGVKGEVYPIKPDVFAATYDIVEVPPSG